MAAKKYFQCKGTFAIPMSDQIDRHLPIFSHNSYLSATWLFYSIQAMVFVHRQWRLSASDTCKFNQIYQL